MTPPSGSGPRGRTTTGVYVSRSLCGRPRLVRLPWACRPARRARRRGLHPSGLRLRREPRPGCRQRGASKAQRRASWSRRTAQRHAVSTMTKSSSPGRHHWASLSATSPAGIRCIRPSPSQSKKTSTARPTISGRTWSATFEGEHPALSPSARGEGPRARFRTAPAARQRRSQMTEPTVLCSGQ